MLRGNATQKDTNHAFGHASIANLTLSFMSDIVKDIPPDMINDIIVEKK
jgi:hypothetical protein